MDRNKLANELTSSIGRVLYNYENFVTKTEKPQTSEEINFGWVEKYKGGLCGRELQVNMFKCTVDSLVMVVMSGYDAVRDGKQ